MHLRLVLEVFMMGGFTTPHTLRLSWCSLFISINCLEVLAVTVSVKLWASELQGQRLLVRTDNKNTELTINHGCSRVPFIQSCLRELWLLVARFDLDVQAQHIAGIQNVAADCLSRWDSDPQFQQHFYEAVCPYYTHPIEYFCDPHLFKFQCEW